MKSHINDVNNYIVNKTIFMEMEYVNCDHCEESVPNEYIQNLNIYDFESYPVCDNCIKYLKNNSRM